MDKLTNYIFYDEITESSVNFFIDNYKLQKEKEELLCGEFSFYQYLLNNKEYYDDFLKEDNYYASYYMKFYKQWSRLKKIKRMNG